MKPTTLNLEFQGPISPELEAVFLNAYQMELNKVMALKLKKVAGELVLDPVKGVDYQSHLGKSVTAMKPVKGVASVTTSKSGTPDPQPISADETVHPGVVTDGHAITVAGSHTINLGNFESARVEVHLTVPCSKADLDDTYEFATNWVSSKIEEAIKNIHKEG
jgi:hypothetical protein